MRILKARDSLLMEFDEGLWNAVVEKLVVKSSELVVFVFRDGSKVEWIIG